MNVNWFLLLISGVFYALAFIASQQLWWLVFIFPLPFFYVALTNKFSFIMGYFWGFLVFSLHLSGVLFSIVSIAGGSYFYRLIPPLFIISYEAFFPATIFWAASKLVICLQEKANSFFRIFIWVGALWLFIHWTDWYCLWLFDRCEGYFLMHPLLPLAEKPVLLQLLPLIGKGLLTFFLLLLPACLVIVFKTKKKIAMLATLLFSLPWLVSWFLPIDQQSPSWVTKVVVLPILFPHSVSFESAISSAAYQFKKILNQYPQVEVIIMPESSFSCRNFSIISCRSLWDMQHLGQSVSVIFGTFRWEGNNYCNSLYWVHNGTLKSYFNKKHAMILIERIPSWFNFCFVHDLYFKTIPQIVPGENKRQILPIMKEVTLVPYICSELFFNEWPDDDYPSIPIIAICNDMWVYPLPCFSYVKKLMRLAARFKAIQWQRSILYVSFTHAVFFDKYGNEKNILRK